MTCLISIKMSSITKMNSIQTPCQIGIQEKIDHKLKEVLDLLVERELEASNQINSIRKESLFSSFLKQRNGAQTKR